MSNPLRNPNINYSDGWFFVTMQVARNKTMFGVIADGRCELNALGLQIGAAGRGVRAPSAGIPRCVRRDAQSLPCRDPHPPAPGKQT
jgi:hypothetical protein